MTWDTDVHVNDCKRQFINFLKNFHLNVKEANLEGVDPPKPFYMKKLDEIHFHQRPFLNVDCTHMNQFDKTMFNQLHTDPEEVIPIFDKAVNELFLTIYKDGTLPHQIQVRPYNVDMFRNMHCLNPEGFH
jgi:DNA replicative helicase MCM subunit Mcm2 (Cdc46/Mcm family)